MPGMRRALILILVLAVPVAAAAQPRRSGGGGGGGGAAQQPPAETPRPAASPYVQKVANGIRLLVARDFDGAIASLREAAGIEATNPIAHYYLGEAQRMKGELSEAIESFRTAARHAAQANEARWQARALQGVADTLERIPDRITEARTAWQEYARFADTHRDVSFPEMARQRIQAIDTWTELELVTREVRNRIEARERENASRPTPAPSR